jgi:hypothetical protein
VPTDPIQLSECLVDQRRVFDAGDDADITTTRADRHAGKASCSQAHKPPCLLSRRSLQVSILIWNTRFSRCAQVIDARRSAGVWSCCCCAAIPFLPLPRPAGVTNARYLLWGANTPWYRVRLTLGLGTRATSLEMKSSGSNRTWVALAKQRGRFARSARRTRSVPISAYHYCRVFSAHSVLDRCGSVISV